MLGFIKKILGIDKIKELEDKMAQIESAQEQEKERLPNKRSLH